MGDKGLFNFDISAIVVAAGKSKRMKGIDKIRYSLGGKPVIEWSLSLFLTSPYFKEVIVVSTIDRFPFLEKILEKYDSKKVIKMVEGGKERKDSVCKGLEVSKGQYVAIHDGARPFVDGVILERLLVSINGSAGCIPVIPVTDTIKEIDECGFVVGTPKRSHLVKVQTPQVFKTSLLLEAYAKLPKDALVTDDAQVMELAGYKVKTVEGSFLNIKITTPLDLEIAHLFVKNLIPP